MNQFYKLLHSSKFCNLVSIIGAIFFVSFGITAHAATFKICAKVDIQTTDSGKTANGITEDYWVDADNPDEYIVRGRGFRVRVSQGAWAQTYDSDPVTGCFTINRTVSTGFGVRVYGYATDSAGNHVRIHNAGANTSSWYPGQTYSKWWGNQTLSSVNSNIFIVNGRSNDRWTTMAAAAFALFRFHNGVSGATISIGFNNGNDKCNSSSSIQDNGADYIESHNAHLIRIGRCNDQTKTDTREKMIITHELGHALARLYYGFDGDDAPRNQFYSPGLLVPAQCRNVSSYGMNSLEWNSQTFKEAFADFYSAKVWNNRNSRGTYVYRGVAYDLEKWDNTGNQNTYGGYTLNVCNSYLPNISTKGDWLRFFWDWYTASCNSQPSQLDMMRLYRMVRENHRSGAFNLSSRSNYDDATKFSILNSIPGLSQCEKDKVDFYMDHNNLG